MGFVMGGHLNIDNGGVCNYVLGFSYRRLFAGFQISVKHMAVCVCVAGFANEQDAAVPGPRQQPHRGPGCPADWGGQTHSTLSYNPAHGWRAYQRHAGSVHVFASCCQDVLKVFEVLFDCINPCYV